jgi:hypothetical protein
MLGLMPKQIVGVGLFDSQNCLLPPSPMYDSISVFDLNHVIHRLSTILHRGLSPTLRSDVVTS